MRPGGRILLLALVGVTSSCLSGDPAAPGATELEAVIYGGNGQYAEPGAPLPDPLEVLVRRLDGNELEDPVRVEWEIVEGSGASLSAETGFTDAAQRARTRLTLGSEPGVYGIRARFPDAALTPVEFTARAAVRPSVSAVGPPEAEPGAEVVIEGSNFLADHGEMTVLFDGIRAESVQGSTTSITVVVPPCLSTGESRVTVGIGSLAADPVAYDVGASGSPLPIPVGGIHVVEDPSALSCVRIGVGGGEDRYLAVVHSSATAGVVLHPFTFAVETEDGLGAGPVPGGADPLGEETASTSLRRPSSVSSSRRTGSAQDAWEAAVRAREAEAIREGYGSRGRDLKDRRPAPVAADPPSIGDRRTFDVLNDGGGFTQVEAEVRFVGDHGVLYVDLGAPQGGFDAGDLEALGREFDDPIHPTLREAYGQESDLDENDRVAILFTPVVNQLTPSGSSSFVGGFFYGVDLLPDRAGSNGGEIFYSLVPDPEGRFGSPRSLEQVLTSVPGILAHEFQHMIHFNQRIIEGQAETAEAVWLAEALATTAEHLIGDVYLARANEERAELFWRSNHSRARRFLEDPSTVGLLIGQGAGTVEERGAGWLFLEHLMGRIPGAGQGVGLLSDLTASTRTGIENVTAAFGAGWSDLVPPWSLALYLDGLGLGVDPRFEFTTLDLRGAITSPVGYPLRPPVVGGKTEVLSESLPSSAALHLLLEPPEGGMALNLGGPYGGALDVRGGLVLSLVRLE